MAKREWAYDCAVIGGGPGGLVTALYLARFRRKIALVGAGKPRVAWGPRIRNLVGYHRGISGKRLLSRLVQQIDAVGGVDFFKSRAKIDRAGSGFCITLENGAQFSARTVVIATGITDKHPAVENLDELRNLGLLKYCSICDGYEVRDRPIAIFAADDFGMQKALFLANWTRKAWIIVPPEMRLAPQRIRELRAAGMKLVRTKRFEMDALDVQGERHLRVSFCGKRKPIVCSVAYVELGCSVNDDAFAHLRKLRRSKEGFLITTIEQRTSIPGLFAVGDCVNLLGQVSVAAGQGAVAATTIHNDLLD